MPLSLFGISFALVEAAVVIYLRALYYPDGFDFPLNTPPDAMLYMELWRELATLAMLGAVGSAAGKSGWQKFAFFMYGFGLWDIFYYVWLKVFIGWPASFFTPDLLFLLPVVWWGPVLAPVVVALSLCIAAVILVRREEEGGALALRKTDVALVTAGACVILYTFMVDAAVLQAGGLPPPYRWVTFWIGEGIGIFGFARFLRRKADG